MALEFTDQTGRFDNGDASVGAKDRVSGNRVVVRVSLEVEQDHGLEAGKIVADNKHSAGRLEADGSVWVRVGDF